MTKRSVGSHVGGLQSPPAVVEQGLPIQPVLPLRPEIAAPRSAAGDCGSLCVIKS